MPIPSEETGVVIGLAMKVGSLFLTFISGVVTATWVVAGKIKGFDDRLKSVEKAQTTCQGVTLVKIDGKLDRIHERIDEILLKGKE